MSWTKTQIRQHQQAAKALEQVKDITINFIAANPNATEHEVQQFILKRFKKHKLKSEKYAPIVAFRENTSHVHYFPSQYSKKLKPNSLILLDLWARINQRSAPYVDITWMAYYGKRVPKKIDEIFHIVVRARNLCLNKIKARLKKKELPSGKELDEAARDNIAAAGYGKQFLHATGHGLGTSSPHGSLGRLNKKNTSRLNANVGYTIEPAIYIKNRFGVRSEINFILTNNRLLVTTPQQKQITIIDRVRRAFL